jgi:hypothetical protein
MILKHDSWAATAVYQDATGRRVVCKFHRVSPLFVFPMGWLGRCLARREQRALRLMAESPGFPEWAGRIRLRGRVLAHAVSHRWIDGETFKPWLRVNSRFFPRLQAMLAALHARDIAYVDMSKWENILVGDDGNPYLLDYQAHFALRRRQSLRGLLSLLQAADWYYLHRHWLRCRPDQVDSDARERWARQPLHVWLVETLGPCIGPCGSCC